MGLGVCQRTAGPEPTHVLSHRSGVNAEKPALPTGILRVTRLRLALCGLLIDNLKTTLPLTTAKSLWRASSRR